MLLESAEVSDPSRFRESDLFKQCVAAGVIPADEADLKRLQDDKPAAEQAGQPETASHNPEPEGQLRVDLTVDGMWCPACAWVIETALSRLEGVSRANCHFSTDRLRCHYRPERTDPHQIRLVIQRLGYTVRDPDTNSAGQSNLRSELVRLAITGLLSANVMMLSWALYAGFFTDLSGDAVFKISLPIFLMATVAVVYGGGPMFRKAWFGIIHLAPGMETLVGLAAGCAYGYSLINWLRGSIHLYFDTACMLITLVLLGKLLEGQARSRVRSDLDHFFAMQPAKARVLAPNWPSGRWVAIDLIAAGDRIVVKKDEIVPVDGRVASGRASIDESALTGEARPKTVRAGEPIKSGTRIVDGRVVAIVDAIGTATVLGQMITIMTNSLAQKSEFEGRTDRMLRWFVPVIVVLAMGTGLAWILVGLHLDQALVRAVTVLVISCPCALGVAIPMARLAGVSMAGRRGILVREIEAFERAGSVDTIVFDKTGTLTNGRWEVMGVDVTQGIDPETAIGWAAGLEKEADHEVARAIIAHAKHWKIPIPAATDVRVHSNGIIGRVDNRRMAIGGDRFIGEKTDAAPGPVGEEIEGPTSSVFLEVDGRQIATFYFGDTIRSTVPELIQRLKKEYKKIAIVSGDGETATRQLARIIDIADAKGNLLPSDKADYIDALTRKGRWPAMVGDGINDAAAMARAHLSVAVHSGQALAAEVAHLTLMRGNPAQLTDFFRLSRNVNRKVMQNLWCAWIYNLIGIPVAASGLLTPLWAATAMLLSSLTVIGNTLLLVRRNRP